MFLFTLLLGIMHTKLGLSIYLFSFGLSILVPFYCHTFCFKVYSTDHCRVNTSWRHNNTKGINKFILHDITLYTVTVPLKKFATTAKHQTPSTPLGGFGAAGRLEPLWLPRLICYTCDLGCKLFWL